MPAPAPPGGRHWLEERAARWTLRLIVAIALLGLLAVSAQRGDTSDRLVDVAPAPTTGTTLPAPPPEVAAPGPGLDGTDGAAATAAPGPATRRSTAAGTSAGPTPTAPDEPVTPPGTAPVAASGPCGGEAPVKGDGQPWTCTFDDEFDGNQLDGSKWVVQETAHGGYHSGPECFVSSPDNVSVGGGVLQLTARQEDHSFLCNATVPYRTQFTSGMVSTWERFTQAFGRFEIRARFPATSIPGLQSSLWLYPQDKVYGNQWPRSGEIDIAEWYSAYSDRVIPSSHYVDAHDPNTTNRSCLVADVGEFHTYTLEWTTSTLTFLYDGQTCMVDTISPQYPLHAPQPFDQPFIVSLTQALGINDNALNSSTPLPATTQIDYVRVWR